MKDDKASSEAPTDDMEVKAATIAVALAGAAERMVPVTGADLPQPPEAQGATGKPSQIAKEEHR